MNYSIFALLCSILCGTSTEVGSSKTMPHGINNVEVDFHSQLSVKKAANVLSNNGEITSTWIWMPSGHEKNQIKSAEILAIFKDDPGSGTEDLDPQEQDAWFADENLELKANSTMRSPMTFDQNRRKSEETAYLVFEKHLRKTNWCFKEGAKTNFKKTKACCQKQRECQTKRRVKRGIHECSCDIYFHKCLKKADTKMAKSIEKTYFDRNIVCYKKDNKTCTSKLCRDARYVWKIIPRHHMRTLSDRGLE